MIAVDTETRDDGAARRRANTAQINLSLTHHFSIASEDFRLISKALRGALRVEDKEAAADLQRRLHEAKEKQLRQLLEGEVKNVNNIHRAHDEPQTN